MSSIAPLTAKERQELLRLWMEERGLTFPKLAVMLGSTPNFCRLMLTRETISQKKRLQMLSLGVPEECLPPAYIGPLGRPPKRGEYKPLNDTKAMLDAQLADTTAGTLTA